MQRSWSYSKHLLNEIHRITPPKLSFYHVQQLTSTNLNMLGVMREAGRGIFLCLK